MKNNNKPWNAISYLSAFVIGVILFAVVWKNLFGSASGAVVLAGMAGVATAVAIVSIRNRTQTHKVE
jgi:hypothetical protein